MFDILKVWNRAQQTMVKGIQRDGRKRLRTMLLGTSKATYETKKTGGHQYDSIKTCFVLDSLIEAFEYILESRLRSVMRPVSRATPMLLDPSQSLHCSLARLHGGSHSVEERDQVKEPAGMSAPARPEEDKTNVKGITDVIQGMIRMSIFLRVLRSNAAYSSGVMLASSIAGPRRSSGRLRISLSSLLPLPAPSEPDSVSWVLDRGNTGAGVIAGVSAFVSILLVFYLLLYKSKQ